MNLPWDIFKNVAGDVPCISMFYFADWQDTFLLPVNNQLKVH